MSDENTLTIVHKDDASPEVDDPKSGVLDRLSQFVSNLVNRVVGKSAEPFAEDTQKSALSHVDQHFGEETPSHIAKNVVAKQVTNAGASVASEAAGSVAAAGEGAASGLASAGIALGPVTGGVATGVLLGLAAVAKTASLVVDGFKKVSAVAEEMVERLSGFSPSVAAAQANNQIRNIETQFRRDERLGPELARFVEHQGEMTQIWEDIKDNIMEVALPVLNQVLSILKDMLTWLRDAARESRQWVEGAWLEVTLWFEGATEWMANQQRFQLALQHAAEDQRDKESRQGVADFNKQIGQFLGAF